MRRKTLPIAQTAEPTRHGPIKTAVNLSVEAHKLLGVAVLDTGRDRSQIVNALILEHCKGYYIGRRGQGETSEDEAAA
jgi:hypothetical protein